MFFITGLPRSRTAWFAEFMTDGDVYCYHEALNGLKQKKEFVDKMNINYTHVGNSDCGLFITNYQEMFPDAKAVIIHRNINDVRASLLKKGFEIPMVILQYMEDTNRKMNGLHVDFNDINKRISEIYTYCTGECINEQRTRAYINDNIQTDITGDPESLLLWG